MAGQVNYFSVNIVERGEGQFAEMPTVADGRGG